MGLLGLMQTSWSNARTCGIVTLRQCIFLLEKYVSLWCILLLIRVSLAYLWEVSLLSACWRTLKLVRVRCFPVGGILLWMFSRLSVGGRLLRSPVGKSAYECIVDQIEQLLVVAKNRSALNGLAQLRLVFCMSLEPSIES